jgi:hypothetical protein
LFRGKSKKDGEENHGFENGKLNNANYHEQTTLTLSIFVISYCNDVDPQYAYRVPIAPPHFFIFFNELIQLLDHPISVPLSQRIYVDPAVYDDPEAALRDFANEISERNLKLERVIGGG